MNNDWNTRKKIKVEYLKTNKTNVETSNKHVMNWISLKVIKYANVRLKVNISIL